MRLPSTLRIATPRATAPVCSGAALRHIYAVSDLHAEYDENTDWCARLSDSRYRSDVLIVAGDVAERLDLFEATMERLVSKFGLVFYVPGNHELWLRRDGSEGSTSLEKLERLEQVCARLGVVTSPQRVQLRSGTIRVCPLLSMHHQSFDTEPGIDLLRLPGVSRAMADYRAMRFPTPLSLGSEALAEHFDGLNDAAYERSDEQAALHAALSPWSPLGESGPAEPLLTFSHFLPRIELCPEKRFLVYPDLMKAVGSRPLGERVAALRPHVHCFGHSHFGWDLTVEGTRYVQAALATPGERRRRMPSLAIGDIEREPLQLYDGEKGEWCAPHSAAWSDHYRRHARSPDDVRPAPWVLAYYRARAPGRVRTVQSSEERKA
tara:strand:- start:94 stop:1227 length:1134 start_codon:yes stop_codon:yes gene_type:complete